MDGYRNRSVWSPPSCHILVNLSSSFSAELLVFGLPLWFQIMGIRHFIQEMPILFHFTRRNRGPFDGTSLLGYLEFGFCASAMQERSAGSRPPTNGAALSSCY